MVINRNSEMAIFFSMGVPPWASDDTPHGTPKAR